MKTKALLAALGICLLAACTTTENKFRVDEALDYCNRQVERTLIDCMMQMVRWTIP